MNNSTTQFMHFVLLVLFSTFSAASVSGTLYPHLSKQETREINCLAKNIYFEARSEPKTGQFAVAAVTMNRVKSWRYPNSVCKVVWQRRQFSWTHDGKSDHPKDKKSWREAKSIAHLVYHKYFEFQSLSNGAWDITKGALNYYAPEMVTPYWAKQWSKHKNAKIQIGKHIFLTIAD